MPACGSCPCPSVTPDPSGGHQIHVTKCLTGGPSYHTKCLGRLCSATFDPYFQISREKSTEGQSFPLSTTLVIRTHTCTVPGKRKTTKPITVFITMRISDISRYHAVRSLWKTRWHQVSSGDGESCLDGKENDKEAQEALLKVQQLAAPGASHQLCSCSQPTIHRSINVIKTLFIFSWLFLVYTAWMHRGPTTCLMGNESMSPESIRHWAILYEQKLIFVSPFQGYSTMLPKNMSEFASIVLDFTILVTMSSRSPKDHQMHTITRHGENCLKV